MRGKRILGIVLAISTIIGNVNITMAKEEENWDVSAIMEDGRLDQEADNQAEGGITELYSFELNNGAELRIEENNEKRVAEYFVNGAKKQRAVLDKSTGDIYYYDMSQQNASLNGYSVENIVSPETYTIKYNMKDFMQSQADNEVNGSSANEVLSYSDNDFKYVDGKTFEDSGETYRRYLYGYTDSRQYRQNSWHFEAGTALSLIAAVCGSIPNIGTILGGVITVGGLIVSAFTIQEWIKELFWVYKFRQTSPREIEFVCNGDFTYEKQRKVEITGDEGYWETFEELKDWEIKYVRDDILTSPGRYI